MLEFIKSITGTYGYLGIMFLMFLESSIFIVPSELIMGLAGYLVYKGVLNLYLATLFAAIGNIMGSTVLYTLSKFGRSQILFKYGGKKVKLGVQKAEKLFKKYDKWAILIAQFIPGVRAFVSIPAGTLNMPFVPFIIATFIGAYLWCGMLGFIAFQLGKNWLQIHHYFKLYEELIFAILLFISVVIIGYMLYNRFYKNKNKQN